MSVKSQVQVAEEALRQALINALAEGDEEHLSELFTQYQAVGDLNKKVQDKVPFDPKFTFDLSSDYLSNIPQGDTRVGGDLDVMDNIFAAGPVNIPSSYSEDVISFGDYKSRDD